RRACLRVSTTGSACEGPSGPSERGSDPSGPNSSPEGESAMNIAGKPKVVLLGMMARLPSPGLIWQTIQYLIGFRRLGYDPYYVEAHGGTPRDLMGGVRRKGDYGSVEAAAFIASVMSQFDFNDRWVFHSRFD